MRKLLLIVLFLAFSYVGVFAQIDANIVQGIVRVKLKADANAIVTKMQPLLKRQGIDAESGKSIITGLAGLDGLNKSYKATSMTRVFPHAGKYEARQELHGLHLWYDIAISEDESSVDIAKRYAIDSNVEIAEPVLRIKAVDDPVTPLIPNDPNFQSQWHYQNTGQSGGTPGVDIRLPNAWAVTTGNSSVIVAVVDGGVDFNHEDLKDNMWVNEAELNGTPGVDDDGNGYIDDIYGFNFVDGYGFTESFPRGPAPLVPINHGTHVAGTIAAVNNNGKGVSGVAGGLGNQRGVRVMSCQTLVDESRGAYIGSAIAYAANNGAVILQNSWGFVKEGAKDESTFEAIKYFIAQAGRDEHGDPRPGTPMVGGIVFFAAGNNSSNGDWYPARYDEVKAVAAVNHYGRRSYYSNFGDWVDISAPGGDTREKTIGGIMSTITNNQYGYMQGTSMACPHVSGVAALVLSKLGGPTYTPDKLWIRLKNTVSSLVPYDAIGSQYMGAGLLNAEMALQDDNGIAPNQIMNLTYADVRAISVKLNWTAPADSDNANAASYEIGYSTTSITDANFESATVVELSSAKVAGQSEEYTLTGLLPTTKYYVALRALDMWGNKSVISNVVSFTTTANQPPVSTGFAPMSIRDVKGVQTVELESIFTDPEGGVLVYTVNNPKASVAQAAISDNKLLITPVAAGTVTFKVTATDPFSASVNSNLALTVTQNNAPAPRITDTAIILLPKNSEKFQLPKYFTDPEGDEIHYSVTVTPSNIASAVITGTELTVTAMKKGNAVINVVAKDAYDAEGDMAINLEVQQYAPENAGELLVYPVPMESKFNYAFTLDADADVEVRAFATNGRLIYQQPKAKYQTGSYNIEVNVSTWSKGLYIIQYLVNGKVMDAKKLVK